MYMYMYMYMYVYVCICLDVYVDVCTCTCLCVSIRICMCICVCICICMCMCICICIYVCLYVCMYVCMCCPSAWSESHSAPCNLLVWDLPRYACVDNISMKRAQDCLLSVFPFRCRLHTHDTPLLPRSCPDRESSAREARTKILVYIYIYIWQVSYLPSTP